MSKPDPDANSNRNVLSVLTPLSQWTLQTSMEDQWSSQQKAGMGTEKDADVLRETLLETSPWLLGTYSARTG